MERRVFIAILLSFAVLYGYQALFVPAAEAGDRRCREEGSGAAPRRLPSWPSPSRPNRRREPEPAAQITDSSEREIVVETAHNARWS